MYYFISFPLYLILMLRFVHIHATSNVIRQMLFSHIFWIYQYYFISVILPTTHYTTQWFDLYLYKHIGCMQNYKWNITATNVKSFLLELELKHKQSDRQHFDNETKSTQSVLFKCLLLNNWLNAYVWVFPVCL